MLAAQIVLQRSLSGARQMTRLITVSDLYLLGVRNAEAKIINVIQAVRRSDITYVINAGIISNLLRLTMKNNYY